MHQNVLYLIRLFYLNANADAVDRWLYKYFFVLVTRDMERVEENFGGGCGFDFWDVVSFGGLRGEIGEGEGGGKGGAHTLEVGPERLRLMQFSKFYTDARSLCLP